MLNHHDPVLSDLSRHLSAQANSDAFDEFRASRLADLAGQYLNDGDLEDAIGTCDNAKQLCRDLWLELEAGNLKSARETAALIMVTAADQYARQQFNDEMGMAAACNSGRQGVSRMENWRE